MQHGKVEKKNGQREGSEEATATAATGAPSSNVHRAIQPLEVGRLTRESLERAAQAKGQHRACFPGAARFDRRAAQQQAEGIPGADGRTVIWLGSADANWLRIASEGPEGARHARWLYLRRRELGLPSPSPETLARMQELHRAAAYRIAT